MLGRKQEAWLADKLRGSRGRWQVLAQQVMMMDLDRVPGEGSGQNTDSWAGYRTPRDRVLRHIKDAGTRSAIILTGDEHQNYAGQVHLDGQRPEAEPVANEFVVTSITSGGDGEDQRQRTVAIQEENPASLKWHNAQRGYVICDVGREQWTTEYKTIDRVSERGGVLSTRQRMVVTHGLPGSLTTA